MNPAARLIRQGLFWEIIFFSIFAVFLIGTILIPLQAKIKATPPGSQYFFADGYLIDYYQYLSLIKQGQDGKIPLHIRYTWEKQTDVIIHPFFTLLGYASRPFHLAPHVVLMIARIGSLITFLLSFILLIRKLLPNAATRILSILLLFSITEIQPIMGQTNFSTLGKFALSPHHLLSIACILCTISIITAPPRLLSSPKFLLCFLLGTFTTFLNPSIGSIILISMAVSIPFIIMQDWRNSLRPVLGIILFTIPSVAVLIYHQVVFQHVSPFTLWYTLAQLYNPAVTLKEYLYALGPILLLPPLLLLNKDTRSHPAVPVLLAWGYVPIILFQLRNGIIPMNAQRIFQSYQYIPLAITGSLALTAISTYRPHIVHWIIVTCFIFYALPSANLWLTQSMTIPNTSYYNIYPSNAAVHAFEYLDTHTPDESVVMAGEFVSNMIPGFTHNRVILGRDDAIADYASHKDQAFAFVDGRMPTQTEWRIWGINHKVDYFLVGVDTHPFKDSTLEKYPYFKEVFHEGNVSVLKVTY